MTAWARSAQEWLTLMNQAIAGAEAHIDASGSEPTQAQTQLLSEMVVWTMPQFSAVPHLATLDDLPLAEVPYLLSQYGTMTDGDLVDLQVRELENGRAMLVRAEREFPASSPGLFGSGETPGVVVTPTGAQQAEEEEAKAYELRWIKWIAGGLLLSFAYDQIFRRRGE